MTIGPCSPMLIVSNLENSLSYYQNQLSFDLRFINSETDPVFAIVSRQQAQIMLKEINPTIKPRPNHTRHERASLDIFIYVSDPMRLSRVLEKANAKFHTPLASRCGLHGFEIIDPDGYVMFFGRPIEHPHQSNKGN